MANFNVNSGMNQNPNPGTGSFPVLAHAADFFRLAVRSVVVAGTAGALAFALTACGAAQAPATTGATAGETSAAEAATTQAESASTSDASASDVDISTFSIDTSALFSARDLDASYDESSATKIALSDDGSKVEGTGAEVSGSTVTITAEGTYVLSGTLSDGRVVVDVEDTAKVQLVLDGASITSSSGCALYVRNADKVFLTLADGSKNVLQATGEATTEDEHTLDGALFSSDDLTVNGTGSLGVESAAGHGIVGKDELTLVSGEISVTAAGSAIQAKDSVAVKDGTYTLSATTDGINAQHDTNGAKGFVYIAGGTFDITCGSDGIDASNDIVVDGGELKIAAGDDGIHSEYDLVINDGTVNVAESYEGLEGATVTVNGGTTDVVASDDGVNAAGVPDGTTSDDSATDAAGTTQGEMGSAPQGMESGAMPEGGMPEGEMPQRPEGEMPEGEMPQRPEGEMPQGEMPQRPGGGTGGRGGKMLGSGDGALNDRMGGGNFENDATASVSITGGTLRVNSGGDGIDSNGSISVTGGETFVDGPTSNGDGPLDCAEASISGGVFVAVGSAGMATGFGSSSTQGSMLVSAQGNAGDTIELVDASGTVLASHTAAKDYACVIVSAPGVQQGSTYTLNYGSQTSEVSLDSVSYSDVAGGFGGMAGR